MKIYIYDLTGNERFAVAEEKRQNDVTISKILQLRNLLIYPRKEIVNRQPYLQDTTDPGAPFIEDFIEPNNREFTFDNSHFLVDILQSTNKKKDGKNLLADFFSCENAFLHGKLNSREESDYNIILVPDDYDAIQQERLLRYSGLSRRKTFLLWRSVAICLGAEECLRRNNVEENTRVAIIDPQTDGALNVSILKMKKDGKALVPSRKFFQPGHAGHKEHYPVFREEMENDYSFQDTQEYEFWRHTWNRDGSFWVPTKKGNWRKLTFYLPSYHTQLQNISADIYLIAGHEDISMRYSFGKRIIRESDNDSFAILGAGRFAVRNYYNLPTYFDECESLQFVYESDDETITSKELIHGNELCKGGREFIGNEIHGYSLLKDQNSVSFYLYTGEENNEAPLKKLKHEFGIRTEKKQPLILHPTMIPGQGIAKVLINASPLLKDKVELDFLSMEDAYYEEGKPETIEHLQITLPRSFPVDFPHVESSYDLYERYDVSFEIDDYMSHDLLPDAGLFARACYPQKNAEGIERFKRINIFGTEPGKEFPVNNTKIFHPFFEKLADDYRSGIDQKTIIRLAAWTYQCGRNEFHEIVNGTIQKVIFKANGLTASMLPQEFTVCANMLSDDEQRLFLKCFNKYVEPIIKESQRKNIKIQRVEHWIRALHSITMSSNNFLEDATDNTITSEDCEKCIRYLCEIWNSYLKYDTAPHRVARVICCILFLLRRRKYDHSFLKDKDKYGDLYKKIITLCVNSCLYKKYKHKSYSCEEYEEKFDLYKDIIKSSEKKYQTKLQAMSSCLFQYLQGAGTIGIPVEDSNDED